MLLNELLQFFKNYRRGTYARIIKQTEKNGFTKRTAMVCRFVNYYNIKEIKQLNKTPQKKDYEKTIIAHTLKENTNTKNILLLVYTTNKHRAHSQYFHNGAEIDEATYYAGINEKKRASAPTAVMCFKIDDVLSLSQH